MAKKAKKEKVSSSFEEIRGTFSAQWGEGSIMSLSDNWRAKCEVIPSQSISLDHAMGVGGFPRGRIVEIYGPEASGKTTLALHAVASAQKLGGKAAFIDAEHALSPALMIDMGVDPERTLVSQPDCGEQALEMCELLVESNSVDVVVIDSVAALTPLAELEGEVGKNVIGAQAKMMSQFLRRIAAKVKKGKCTVIFINQIRHKIGVMFGSPETTPGGNALKFYCSIRLDIRRRQQMKDGDNIIGHEARVKVIKNKVAVPFKVADVPLIYGKGIDYVGDILKMAAKYDVVTAKGSHYSYGEHKLGNGVVVASSFLKENMDITDKIEADLREVLFPESELVDEPPKDAEDKDTDENLDSVLNGE